MKTIIAFTGKKQTGKSTAAGYLSYRYKYERINFKDALTAEIKERFMPLLIQILNIERMRVASPVRRPNTIEELFVFKPPLVRTLMQCYGTDVRRKDDPDYWVKRWYEKIDECDKDIIVVDDVRFPNEAQAVRSLGGRIYRIERDITSLGQKIDMHASETEMDKIKVDEVIDNNAYTDDLYRKLDKLIV
jgi:dephospho-CoA kinase